MKSALATTVLLLFLSMGMNCYQIVQTKQAIEAGTRAIDDAVFWRDRCRTAQKQRDEAVDLVEKMAAARKRP